MAYVFNVARQGKIPFPGQELIIQITAYLLLDYDKRRTASILNFLTRFLRRVVEFNLPEGGKVHYLKIHAW